MSGNEYDLNESQISVPYKQGMRYFDLYHRWNSNHGSTKTTPPWHFSWRLMGTERFWQRPARLRRNFRI